MSAAEPRIELFTPPGRPWGMPNLSPFAIKLETYLRVSGHAYTWHAADFRRAPKGKVPYVTIDGQLLGDSQLIIEALERRRGNTLDAPLDDRQRATGHALRRMLDEGLYFNLAHGRWADEAAWRTYRPVIGARMPAPLRLAMPLIRRSVVNSLRSQGTGRHAPAEIAATAVADLQALAILLGDQDFLFGGQPSTFDCSAFAFVEGVAGFPHDSPPRRCVLESQSLMDYRQRIRHRWFRDLPAG